ncbi:hypothetical protein WJX79_008263 [Trebouxia sp. C0005]
MDGAEARGLYSAMGTSARSARAFRGEGGPERALSGPVQKASVAPLATNNQLRTGGRHCQVGSLAGAAHLLKDNAVRIQTVKAWPIDPLDLRDLKLEVSENVPQG